ncbi:MAG: hypothetical protein LBF00_02225 [Mycoplasmataceae bacterium]|jgi:hypothetical protein|nr:hypothetical protein [Mycoplasmataceae bacterium]
MKVNNWKELNQWEHEVTIGYDITVRYLTKDHKQPQSISDQYVEIYSKVTQKTLTMPLKELQEGLKSSNYVQKLAYTLLKSPFGPLN